MRGHREHEHSEATGPGDTHHAVSDMVTSLGGSVHGLHRKHVVRNIRIQYEQSAMGCRQRGRIFSRDSSRVDTQAGKASFTAAVLKMRPSTVSFSITQLDVWSHTVQTAVCCA